MDSVEFWWIMDPWKELECAGIQDTVTAYTFRHRRMRNVAQAARKFVD